MTRQEFINAVTASGGKWFGVEFDRRSGGRRVMLCRVGVHCDGSRLYDEIPGDAPATLVYSSALNLIHVYDRHRKARRSIPVEGVLRTSVAGEWQAVTD